jgi:ankyrin repeat protein
MKIFLLTFIPLSLIAMQQDPHAAKTYPELLPAELNGELFYFFNTDIKGERVSVIEKFEIFYAACPSAQNSYTVTKAMLSRVLDENRLSSEDLREVAEKFKNVAVFQNQALISYFAAEEKRLTLEQRLRQACILGQIERVKSLLADKVNANAKNWRGSTVLANTASSRNTTNQQKLIIMQLLIENGAQANCKDATGAGPLHWAANDNAYDLIALLLKAGADPNIVDDENESVPLNFALTRVNIPIIEALLKAGADPNIGKIRPANSVSRSPLQYAKYVLHNNTITDLLTKYGAHDGSTQPSPEATAGGQSSP